MVVEQSAMLALGTSAPPFELPDIDGRHWSLDDVVGQRATLVMFLCPHCPYVKHVQDELGRLTAAYLDRGVGAVAVNANDLDQRPDDGPEAMRAQAATAGFRFPYLIDETQQVAKAYQAVCTPDFFVFDAQRRLAYRGQMDGSRPRGDHAPDGADLRAALDALIAGARVPAEQQPSMGCNIKWKPGNEPR